MPNVLIDSTTIAQAETDFHAIKQSIIDRGTAIPSGMPTSDYPSKIAEMQGDGCEYSPFVPNPTWWDIETIVKNEEPTGERRVIALLNDTEPSSRLLGATSYKTSDGAEYTAETVHVWDTSKDLQCDLGYKTRYVIYYYEWDATLHDSIWPLNNSFLYFVATRLNIINTKFEYFRSLKSFKLINNSKLIVTSKNIFKNCYSLEYVPQIDTSANTDFDDFFEDCSGLKFHEPIDISLGTKFKRFYSDARTISAIPSIKVPDGTSTPFFQCYSLMSINEVVSIDGSVSFSDSYLNYDTALRIIAGLADRTGQAQAVLTLSSRTLQLLTPAEIAVATAKNWSVV